LTIDRDIREKLPVNDFITSKSVWETYANRLKNNGVKTLIMLSIGPTFEAHGRFGQISLILRHRVKNTQYEF